MDADGAALFVLLTHALMVGDAALTTLDTPTTRTAAVIRAARNARRRVGDLAEAIGSPIRCRGVERVRTQMVPGREKSITRDSGVDLSIPGRSRLPSRARGARIDSHRPMRPSDRTRSILLAMAAVALALTSVGALGSGARMRAADATVHRRRRQLGQRQPVRHRRDVRVQRRRDPALQGSVIVTAAARPATGRHAGPTPPPGFLPRLRIPAASRRRRPPEPAGHPGQALTTAGRRARPRGVLLFIVGRSGDRHRPLLRSAAATACT